jgi:hypothetical protein
VENRRQLFWDHLAAHCCGPLSFDVRGLRFPAADGQARLGACEPKPSV